MKKNKKLESLKSYELSGQETSILDGGYIETGGGCKADGKTWISDATYSTAMGDSSNWQSYEWGDFGFAHKDACIVNPGGGFGSGTGEFQPIDVNQIGALEVDSIGALSFTELRLN